MFSRCFAFGLRLQLFVTASFEVVLERAEMVVEPNLNLYAQLCLNSAAESVAVAYNLITDRGWSEWGGSV